MCIWTAELRSYASIFCNVSGVVLNVTVGSISFFGKYQMRLCRDATVTLRSEFIANGD